MCEWKAVTASPPPPPSPPPASSTPGQCVGKASVPRWGNCKANSCCANPDDTCFYQNQWYSQCRPGVCPKTWECNPPAQELAASSASSGSMSVAIGLAGVGVALILVSIASNRAALLAKMGLRQAPKPATTNDGKYLDDKGYRDSTVRVDVGRGVKPQPPRRHSLVPEAPRRPSLASQEHQSAV